MFSSDTPEPKRFSETFQKPLKCRCGQQGIAIILQRGPSSDVLTISDGFFMRVQTKDLLKTEIACAVCELTVKD